MYISFLRNLFHEINFSDVLLLTITGQQQNTAIFSLCHTINHRLLSCSASKFHSFETPLKFRRNLNRKSPDSSTLSRETRNLTQQSEKPSEIYRRNDEILVKPQILRNLGNQS